MMRITGSNSVIYTEDDATRALILAETFHGLFRRYGDYKLIAMEFGDEPARCNEGKRYSRAVYLAEYGNVTGSRNGGQLE